jgi:RNA polymerase sigma-70 factor, ECF subfamily
MNVDNVFVLGIDKGLEADARIERLACEHQTKLARYLRRFVADRELALDLTQDVFLSAHRMLRADPSRPLTAGWLYKTATNHALSHLRKTKRRGETLPLEEAGSSFRLDERSAESLDLQRALGTLAPEQAACLMLTAYAGYSSSEAALLLGISAAAVRQRVCRATRTLRAALAATA